ncbi:hypothetical protein G4B88_003873 [Cannabis sativa]|uniref:Uncharacterized protein n=1 Tax=Cannabis sativa TaxID=3483 RepID=A0A7J6E827_CANSA|nr:hypothetical protein G4B88_003873 [Cannabis sativa]
MPRNETLHTREGIVVKEGDIAGEDVQEGTWVPLTVRLKTTRRLPQPERLRVPQAISKSHSVRRGSQNPKIDSYEPRT